MDTYQNAYQDVIDRCKRGERKAQYQLYSQYKKAMYSVCLRICGDSLEAEDILQEAFLQAYTQIHSYRQEASFGAWLKRIVVNTAINQVRKRKIDAFSLDDSKVEVAEEPTDESALMLKVENVKKAIQQLPEGYRVVFSLYLLEGYDHQEIAEILNISLSTSKTQYTRAKRKLIDILKNFNHE